MYRLWLSDIVIRQFLREVYLAPFFTKRVVRSQKTIGQILKKTRISRDISLLSAESDTQIRLKYLEALERDDFSIFSAQVYALGFLRRYAVYLGLDADNIIERYESDLELTKNLEKKQLIKSKQKDIFNQESNEYKQRKPINISPQIVLSCVIALFVVGFFGYVWFQVKSFAASPDIEINNPTNEIVVMMDNIIVEGKTDAGASLFINDQVVTLDAEGKFSQQIKLISGLNTIEIKAKNKADRETVKTIQVLMKN